MMRRVRVGVVGVGQWGENHVAIYNQLPHVEVVGVCDIDKTRAKEVAAKYDVPRWSARFQELTEDPDIDALSIVSIEWDHLASAVAAMRSGKHVLVEKPVAVNAGEAGQMRDVAQEEGVYCVPGHVLRFEPKCATVQQSADQGELGDLVSLYSRRSRPRSAYAVYQRTHPVYELGVHDIDLALWYIQARVQRVTAFERNIQGGKNPDLLWIFLEFENGVVACIENNWFIPESAGVGICDLVEVIGTKGMAHIDLSDQGVSVWTDQRVRMPEVGLEPRLHGSITGAIRAELDYFTTCVLRSTPPKVLSMDDAVHGIEIIEAVLESVRTNQPVRLSSQGTRESGIETA